MEVDIAVLADSANKSENGKLNILGIFDQLGLGPDFPATSPTFSLVVRFVGHPSETGRHKITFRLADADGQEVAKFEGGFEARQKKSTAKPYKVPVIIQSQVKFPHPGDYVFDVLVDGRWETSIPVTIQKRSS